MSPSSQAYKDAWSRVRAAIKDELVDRNMEYPEGWASGWLVPGDERAADALLDYVACMAVRAAFGIETDEN